MSTEYSSLTIEKLKNDIKNGNSDAIEGFWQRLEREGSPIIESIKGVEDSKIVTFVFQGDKATKNLVVITALVDQDNMISNNVCNKIIDTNIFYKSFIVRNGTRTIYTFSKNNSLRYYRFYDNLIHHWDTLFHDPYNPKKYFQRYRREGGKFEVKYSVLEMPDTKPQLWTIPKPNTVRGNLKELDFSSKILDEKRRIWVYMPPHFRLDAEPYHLAVVFDGKAFIDFTQTPLIYDNLLAENKVPPLVSIFIHNYSGFSRGKDLSCYPPFAEFVAKELIPWARENYNVSSNPEHLCLIGSSSGGLAASYIALKYPDIFMNVLTQSGWYGWYPGYDWFQHSLQFYGKDYVRWWTEEEENEPEWLTGQFQKSPRLPLKFYINVGHLETRALNHVTNFKSVIDEKGYQYLFEEYPGGHEYIAWREHLPEGLIYLIGIKK